MYALPQRGKLDFLSHIVLVPQKWEENNGATLRHLELPADDAPQRQLSLLHAVLQSMQALPAR